MERLLADLVVVLHLAFIAFVVLGGLLGLVWRHAPWLHLPAACWGVFIELSGGICPLTPLEISLRRAAGEAGFEGGFVEHYLVPVVYPVGLTRELQLALAAFALGVNLFVYVWVWRRRNGSRRYSSAIRDR